MGWIHKKKRVYPVPANHGNKLPKKIAGAENAREVGRKTGKDTRELTRIPDGRQLFLLRREDRGHPTSSTKDSQNPMETNPSKKGKDAGSSSRCHIQFILSNPTTTLAPPKENVGHICGTENISWKNKIPGLRKVQTDLKTSGTGLFLRWHVASQGSYSRVLPHKPPRSEELTGNYREGGSYTGHSLFSGKSNIGAHHKLICPFFWHGRSGQLVGGWALHTPLNRPRAFTIL